MKCATPTVERLMGLLENNVDEEDGRSNDLH